MLLEDGKVKQVGAPSEVQQKAPAGAKAIDLGSETLLPGLIDSHTHLLLDVVVLPEAQIARHLESTTPARIPATGVRCLSPHVGRGTCSITIALLKMVQFSGLGQIDASKTGAKIDRNIFGQFAEHLGHGIYKGIWVGFDSKIRNTRGIRNDVVRP